MKLSDKVVLVTGAGSGIGRETARRLAADGASVVLCDINRSAIESAAGEVEALGRVALALPLDVASPQQWGQVAEQVARRFGGLYGLVNAAGLARPGTVEDTTIDDWRLQIEVNLNGTFLGCRTALPLMKSTGRGGSIVNVSSLAALLASDDTAAYNASKAGVSALTKSVAMHGGKLRPPIRCNAMLPGYVDTPMLAPMSAMVGGHDKFMALLASCTPIGDVVKPADVAALAAFLLSDDARMISGADIPIDGGLLAGGDAPPAVVRKYLASTSRSSRADT